MHVQKSRRGRVVGLLLGSIATSVALIGVFAASAANSTMTFNGAPAAPQAFSDAEWDFQVHSRDQGSWYSLPAINAGHGPDCSAPPATHANTSYEGSVFQCRDHVMTAINGSAGYGAVYMTPNRLVDFSSGEAVVSWDMSTQALSSRDWIDIWITPWADNLAMPLDAALPDLQGPPKNAIHVAMTYFNSQPTFFLEGVYQDGVNVYQAGNINMIETSTQSATLRERFELRISQGHVKFSMPGRSITWVDSGIPTLNFSQGVVTWGHHSYTPEKDNAGVPNTWHWDNMSISPAVPFTMIKALSRYVDGSGQRMDFASPAPANSYLRFSGICSISVDGVAVSPQVSTRAAEHFSSYFVPIAQGKTSVTLGFGTDGWYSGDCMAKDFSIWSLSGAGSPATPTRTATATATPTTPPGTTPTATPTSTQSTTTPMAPTATPTNTPTVPAATPTQSPSSPSTTAGSRITWQGKQWYLNGANLPWYNWGCDFGCGSGSGASSTASKAAIESAFAGAKANGVNVIRWWVFPGDPWQITRDTSGKPTGLNSAIYADFDAAVALAAKYDIYLDFVLFNAPSAVPQSWLTDSNHRTALTTTLGPLFARYANNPRVMTWEVFNEPEWEIWNNQADLASTQALVKAIAGSVHANSDALVTVGSAMLEGAEMWVGQGLDYYQAHWYDFMASGGWCARCRDYASVKAEYNLDAPLVLGEFYAGPDSDALSRFEDFYAKGYAGAWAWSLMTNRTSDGMVVDLAAAKTFASRHSDLGPKGSTSAPTPTATSTPKPLTPTATATPKPASPAPTAPAAPSASFKVTAAVSKTFARTGDSQKVTARVTASAATKGLVDIEIYSPSGEKVFQKYYDNTAFAKDQTRSFSPSWRVPRFSEKGTYTVKVGVFSPGWGTLHYWSESAATFTVR